MNNSNKKHYNNCQKKYLTQEKQTKTKKKINIIKKCVKK